MTDPELSWYSDRGLQEKIFRKLETMSDAFDDLAAEVQEDIKDDAARDQRIADLEAANAALSATAQAAVDQANLAEADKAALQSDLDAKTQAVADQVALLRSSDYPNA